jgi:hypothetical protein
MMIIGIMLWAAGRRVLRAGLVAGGLLLGATIGWIIADLIDLSISPLIFVGVGAILLGCLAALTFRLAIAGTLALVFGIAGPMLVLTVGEIQGLGKEAQDDTQIEAEDGDVSPDIPVEEDDTDEWIRRYFEDRGTPLPEADEDTADAPRLEELLKDEAAKGFVDPDSLHLTDEAKEQIGAQIGKLRGYAEWAVRRAGELWDQSPEELRPQMVGAAVIGVLIGVMLGALLPTFSASIVTAFGGSLLMLTNLRVLGERLGAADAPWMPSSAMTWLIVWIVTALIGTAIQWTFRPKPADNSD